MQLSSIHNLDAFPNFSDAALAVLEYLHDRLKFDLWMVTRTEGNDWIVLEAHDRGYGIKPGHVFPWSDSFCSRMVRDEGPRVAPRAKSVAVYAETPLAKQLSIGAYIGVPLARADGSLFGTLCGLHPQPKDESITHEQPLIELFAKLLSSLLATELESLENARRADRAEADLMTDSLTGLFNRRGWDSLLAAEESRCRRYGNPACVVSVDLDELKEVNDTQGHAKGDELLRTTAAVLKSVTRHQDIVARIGGDEFVVLAVECDQAGGQSLVERLLKQLAAVGVRASVGVATRHPANNLQQTWLDSDRAMYAHKRRTPTASKSPI